MNFKKDEFHLFLDDYKFFVDDNIDMFHSCILRFLYIYIYIYIYIFILRLHSHRG